MEELQKTQEYPIEREQEERRVEQRPFPGEERRKRANWASTVLGSDADSGQIPVYPAEGTKPRTIIRE
jgi:hypothetical protein